MKNVTFSADEQLIERAREKAKRDHKTLNTAFREWLERYAGSADRARDFDQVMDRLSGVRFPGSSLVTR